MEIFELLRRFLDEVVLSLDKDVFDKLFFDFLDLLFDLFLEIIAVFTFFSLLLSFLLYFDLDLEFAFDLLEEPLFLLFPGGSVFDFCETLLDDFNLALLDLFLLLSDLRLIFDELCLERAL